MAFLIGIEHCPKCGERMSSPIRSLRATDTYVQTCRNVRCMYCHRTVVQSAPEPERPRPQPLFERVPADVPAPARRSAIDEFERAYAAGDTRKAIKRAHQRLRAANAHDAQQRRLGRNL